MIAGKRAAGFAAALCLLLVLLCAVPAHAADDDDRFQGKTWDEVVEVFLSCDENPGFSGAALNIGFDPDVLQYDGCTTADGFDPDIFSAVETEGQLRIAFTDRQADFYMTGRLLTVRFRIVGETESDSLSRLTLSAPAGAVADVRYRSVECRVTDGGVYVGSAAIHLLPGSAYVLDRERGYVTGVAPQTAPEAFLQQFTGSPSFSPSGSRYVFTGSAVAAGSERYTVVVTGDLNGDGTLTASDYLLAKRAIVLDAELTEIQTLAADVSGDGKLTASDYLLLKKSVLGLG